jgi:hypothetical protein
MKKLQAIQHKLDEATRHLDLLVEGLGDQRKYIEIRKQEIINQTSEIKHQRLELQLNSIRVARNQNAKQRSKANKLSKEYDIPILDDSSYQGATYYLDHWVDCPDWIAGADPLEDGHHSSDWSTTLWLVEFYAKHHPKHPDHASRECLKISPHC